NTHGRNEDRGGSGNVERADAVAAGADDVDSVFGGVHRDHLFVHDRDGSGDLTDAFALETHAHKEGTDLAGRGFAGHNDAHDRAHFLASEVAALGDLVQGLLDIHQAAFFPVKSRAMLRKFCRRAWPFSEAMLSGWNCTPCTGSVLCCMPMMRPSSVVAVTSSVSGRVSCLTIRLW